ncbi:MAG: hypothetical protein JWN44_2850 [Myxococcales bacterium]|nr:hypothetical protein [Myxococcales bacterium]
MEMRPSDEELAAAVGAAGKKVKRLRGGPYLYQFEVDGRAREVLVVDGKVAPKGLPAVGRYLQAIGFLDKKQMKFDELLALVAAHGELPSGFEYSSASLFRGPVTGPALEYLDGAGRLVIYRDEAAASSTRTPGAPMPPPGPRGAGPTRPRWLRATLTVPPDYELRWTVERYVENSNDSWTPL